MWIPKIKVLSCSSLSSVASYQDRAQCNHKGDKDSNFIYLLFHAVCKLLMGRCNKNPSLWPFFVIKNWCWEKRIREGCPRKVAIFFLAIASGSKCWNNFLLPLWQSPVFPNVCTFNLNYFLLYKWGRLSNVFGKKKKNILYLVYELLSTTGAWIITKEIPPNTSFSALRKYCSFAPYFMPLDETIL